MVHNEEIILCGKPHLRDFVLGLQRFERATAFFSQPHYLS